MRQSYCRLASIAQVTLTKEAYIDRRPFHVTFSWQLCVIVRSLPHDPAPRADAPALMAGRRALRLCKGLVLPVAVGIRLINSSTSTLSTEDVVPDFRAGLLMDFDAVGKLAFHDAVVARSSG